MFGLDWVIPLLTLTAMEIVLGIDNIIFITLLVGKLPPPQQPAARQMGLGVALGTRLLLLLALSWILSLDAPLFHLTDLGVPAGWLKETVKEDVPPEARAEAERHAEGRFQEVNGISWRDIILIVGGLFLIGKATYEIHDKLEGEEDDVTPGDAVDLL